VAFLLCVHHLFVNSLVVFVKLLIIVHNLQVLVLILLLIEFVFTLPKQWVFLVPITTVRIRTRPFLRAGRLRGLRLLFLFFLWLHHHRYLVNQLKQVDAVLRVAFHDLLARDVAEVALEDLALKQFDKHLQVLGHFLLRLTRLQVIEVDLGKC